MKRSAILIQDNSRLKVNLIFHHHQLEFISDGIKMLLSYKEIDIEMGGANSKYLFFKSKEKSQFNFYLEIDLDLVHFLQECDASHWTLVLKKARRKILAPRYFVAGSLSLVVLTSWLLISQTSWFIDRALDHIPYEIEQKVGEALVTHYLSHDQTVHDVSSSSLLQEILSPLKQNIPRPYHELKIYISQSSELNAFALPGGHLVFNKGLLLRAKSVEEILGVAAHEVAHVTQRHVLRNLIQSLGVFSVLSLFFGDITGIMGVIVDQSSLLVSRSFSREFEEQADQIGLDYLLKSQVDPRGLISFLEQLDMEYKKNKSTLEELESSKRNKIFEIYGTHPSTEKRVEILKNKIQTIALHSFNDMIKEQKLFSDLKKHLTDSNKK